ncbi:MAG: hypothetical protein DRP65_00085 [Planctomycetota bacterium]|nr:MAG: hypothetical protein DRP65_00085 [Planctomycetota bacterium]
MCGRQTDKFRFGPREVPVGFICDGCWNASRSPEKSGHGTVRELPKVWINGKWYYTDERLVEFRAVNNPHDRITFEDIIPDIESPWCTCKKRHGYHFNENHEKICSKCGVQILDCCGCEKYHGYYVDQNSRARCAKCGKEI